MLVKSVLAIKRGSPVPYITGGFSFFCTKSHAKKSCSIIEREDIERDRLGSF